MERSFDLEITEPNDELMWANVLPDDVKEREEFWLKDMALNIWKLHDIADITKNTYFAHIRYFNFADSIIQHVRSFERRCLIGGD